MKKISISKKNLQKLLCDAYLEGFNFSGEGSNGEYPYRDKDLDPEKNRFWKQSQLQTVSSILKGFFRSQNHDR